MWREAGARTGNLNASAASFYRYGDANRTWRTGNPRVGDAVVFGLNSNGTWARHVGIVTAVLTTVEGNAGPNTDRVHTTTFTRPPAACPATPRPSPDIDRARRGRPTGRLLLAHPGTPAALRAAR